jgi:hypothetical protein
METVVQPILEKHRAWSTIVVRDTESMPWRTDRYGRRAKLLFRDEATSGQLVLLSTEVDSVGGPLRYHNFHEWAYRLCGDVFYNESPTVPLSGPLVQYREGHFLNRYPHSLHGGETPAEFGGVVLVMEEGHLTNETFLADAPDFAEQCVYNNVKQWTSPASLDTMSDLSWQDSIGHTGVRFKHLAEDTQNGFRVILWLLPAGWRGAGNSFAEPHYFEHAHQFNFVLKGNLKVTSYETSTSVASHLTLRKHSYMERPPGSIAGLAEDEVTTEGCIWLEVTYARSARVGAEVIEARKYPHRSAAESDRGGWQ